MSEGTKIEWCHIPNTTVPATMNALVGCRKVSGKVTLSEKALLEPLTKRKPHTYFVNSMSDLFCEWDPVTETGVRDEWIDRHYAVFGLCPQHTFIVLTKRPERMQKYLSDPGFGQQRAKALGSIVYDLTQDDSPFTPQQMERMLEATVTNVEFIAERRVAWTFKMAKVPLPNVWHLVSVEDQKSADDRIPLLLQTPSAVRGVSCEPALGPVDIEQHLDDAFCVDSMERTFTVPKLDWVICGGESGAGARPMHPDWARGLRDQCQSAGVPFFMKQMGSTFGPNKGKDIPDDLLIRQFPEVR